MAPIGTAGSDASSSSGVAGDESTGHAGGSIADRSLPIASAIPPPRGAGDARVLFGRPPRRQRPAGTAFEHIFRTFFFLTSNN